MAALDDADVLGVSVGINYLGRCDDLLVNSCAAWRASAVWAHARQESSVGNERVRGKRKLIMG